jgi:hypothetical protein
MFRRSAPLFSVLLLYSTIATAGEYEDSFRRLYDECVKQSVFCYGYLRGVSDTLSATLPAFVAHKNHWEFSYATCIKPDITYGMIAQTIVNYGQQHTEVWSEGMWEGAFSAFHNAWPCR